MRQNRKGAAAKKLGESIRAGAIAQGGTLEGAAKAAGVPFVATEAFARVSAPFNGNTAIGTAFGIQLGQISQPVEGGGGQYYVMQLLGRVPADSAEFIKDLSTLRQRALDGMRQLQLRQYLTALRTSAEIVDNRDKIFKTAAQVEAETPAVPVRSR